MKEIIENSETVLSPTKGQNNKPSEVAAGLSKYSFSQQPASPIADIKKPVEAKQKIESPSNLSDLDRLKNNEQQFIDMLNRLPITYLEKMNEWSGQMILPAANMGTIIINCQTKDGNNC